MKQTSNKFNDIPDWLINKWQEIVDLLAEIINVPSALIMKTENEYMEVFVSSNSNENPYKVGDKEKWYGLYCETVIKSQKELLIPNALNDKNWDKNPDIKLGMISYLGYPINFPDKKPFGTICILDNKENKFSETYKKLILKFKNIIENDLLQLNILAAKEEGLLEQIDNSNEELLKKIAENFPNSYISIIERDLTVGFSAGQEFKKHNLNPDDFVGLSLEQVFGDKATIVEKYYLETFKGNQTSFELFINNQHQLYKAVPLFNQNNEISRILVVVENITEWKKAEKELIIAKEKAERNEAINKARLHLLEFSADHSIDELLEETLNETEKLTNSKIGFYHFVNEDQKSLSLQNWSTSTKAHFCKAEAKITHYPLSEAGVWVECVYENKPIIHNDYASLPNKKGMPEGHAEVIRELVVPVIAGKEIKAILGVGNKGTDYNEDDVEVVSLLSNFAFEIVERKRAEIELKEKNVFIDKIIQSSAISTWISDSEGTAIMANQACLDFFGAKGEEVIGKYNLFKDEVIRSKGLLHEIHRLFNEKVPVNFTIDYDFKDVTHVEVKNASHKILTTTLTPILDDKNHVSNVIVQAFDLTELENAKARAEQNERRLSAFSHATNEAIFFSKNGICIDTNEAASKMFGYSYDELIGIFGTDVIAPESKEMVKNNMLSGYEKPYDAIGIRKDGTRFYIELQGKMFEYEGEKVRVTACRDITQRKLQEKLLQEAKEKSERNEIKLKEAQSIAHIGHWELDLIKNDLYWSDEIYRIFNCQPQEFGATYEAFLSFVHPADRDMVDKAYNNHLRTKAPYEVTHRILLPNQEIKYVNERCKSEFDEKDMPLRSVGTVSDITEIMTTKLELEKHKNQLEELVHERTERLEQALKELEQAQEHIIHSEKMVSLGILTAGVAHEINNPLNYIQSSVYGLENLINRNKLHESPEQLKKILETIKEGVKRTSNVVKALNEFSHSKINVYKTINIHDIINKCLLSLKAELENRCVVQTNYCSSQFTLKGNRESIHQVIKSLLTNSIQAINKDGLITVATKLIEGKDKLLIKISDNGVGISKENITKIFDPFFTTKDPGKGTGLGLSVSYNVIKEHRGEISVESEPGKGTSFTIQLPIEK